MTTEDKMDGVRLSDDQLDSVVGGMIHQNANGQWAVIDDDTSQAVKTFDSKQAAIAYAKKFGYSTKIV